MQLFDNNIYLYIFDSFDAFEFTIRWMRSYVSSGTVVEESSGEADVPKISINQN